MKAWKAVKVVKAAVITTAEAADAVQKMATKAATASAAVVKFKRPSIRISQKSKRNDQPADELATISEAPATAGAKSSPAATPLGGAVATETVNTTNSALGAAPTVFAEHSDVRPGRRRPQLRDPINELDIDKARKLLVVPADQREAKPTAVIFSERFTTNLRKLKTALNNVEVTHKRENTHQKATPQNGLLSQLFSVPARAGRNFHKQGRS